MKAVRRIAGGVAALGVATAMAHGAAGADPQHGFAVTLKCDNAKTYNIVTNGNGDFTPAHVVGGTATLVPVSFGAFTGVVKDTKGKVVDTFTDPAMSKGQSAKGLKDPVKCTFTFTEVSDGSDPEFPAGYTFTGSGSAVVRVTPSN